VLALRWPENHAGLALGAYLVILGRHWHGHRGNDRSIDDDLQ